MTEKDLEIQTLRKQLADREKDISMLMELVDSLCVRFRICGICENLDANWCVPEYRTCNPRWNKRFKPKS